MNALVNEVAALAYREQMSAFHSVEEQYFSLTQMTCQPFIEHDFINSLLEVMHCMRISLCVICNFLHEFQQWRNL